MRTVSISEIAGYNETDHACNGGFYRCPYCHEQLYVSKSEDGDIQDCYNCGNEHEITET